MSDAEKRYIHTVTTEYAIKFCDVCQNNETASNDTVDPAANEEMEPQSKHMKTSNALGSLFGDMYQSNKDTRNVYETIKQEVYHYSHECVITMDDDPLNWWKDSEAKYKYLSRVAKQLLVVQATSVASERIFSTAGDIVSEKRSRLDGELVNAIIFLNKNHELVVIEDIVN